MASSGTINNTFRTGYAIRILWDIDSQDIIHNTSTVTARVQLVSLGSTYNIISSVTKYGSLTIDGVPYNFTFMASLTGGQTKTLYTKTVTIAHGSDGSKTCAFSTTCGINVTLTNVYWGNVTASGNGVFNTIARASTIESVTPSIVVDGTNVVAVSIDSASASFTHDVVWKFGSYSFTALNAGTFISYAIPMEWLNAIPNSTTGSGTVTITTNSGNTKIGASDYASFQLVVPEDVHPSISSIGITEATEGIAEQFGGFVQNKTRFNVAAIGQGAYSSTIESYKTTIDGVVYYGNPSTSGVITSSGTVSFTIVATDSRGRTITETRQRTVIPYEAPTISRFSVYRSDGNGTQTYEGCCVCMNTKFDISPVNNLNTKSYTLEYKVKSASTWSNIDLGSAVYTYDGVLVLHDLLTTDNSYDFRLTITDFFTSATAVTDIPTAFTLVDCRANGMGIAFGKVSEKNAMEVAMDIIDRTGITIRNGLAFYEASGNTDPDDTMEHLILTENGTPAPGGFYYILTFFYQSRTGNRSQLAIPYNQTTGLYFRFNYNGTWSAWQQ